MLKTYLVSFVILTTTVPALALTPPTSPSLRMKAAAYVALTNIATADTPPPVSNATAINDLKTRPHEVLVELCYYAGALQTRLRNLTVTHPYIYQVGEPHRTQIQNLINSGQESLRVACELSAANSKLSLLQRVTNVQNTIGEVTTEALKIRSQLNMSLSFGK